MKSSIAFACTALATLPLAGSPRPCLAVVEDIMNARLAWVTRDGSGTLRLGDGTVLNLGGKTQAPAAHGLPSVIPMSYTDNGKKTKFSLECKGAGAKLLITQSASERNYYHQYHYTYRGADGVLYDIWVVDGKTWEFQQINRGGRTNLPAAASDPVGFLFKGQYHALWLDADGGIQDAYYDAGWKTQKLNVDGVTGAAPAAGAPSAAIFNDQFHISYRDRNNNIQDVYYDGKWNVQQLNSGGVTAAPAAAGDVASVVYADQYHVTYLDAGGGLQDIYYDGRWNVQKLNGGGRTSAPLGQGSPSAVVYNGDQFHAVYRAEDGSLQDAYYADGGWKVQKLTRGGLTDGKATQSEPAVQCLGNAFHVGYEDVEGSFQLVSYRPEAGWTIDRKN